MTLTIKRQFVPSTDEAAIAAFEGKIGFALPLDYRAFLSEFNGGEPQNPVFEWKSRGDSYADSAVRYFFSITEKPTFSLLHKYTIYAGAGRIAPEMLPIAGDSGGNLVLLALAGENAGRLFFWDHDIEGVVENSTSADHLIPIANSFGEFCDKLQPFREH